MSTIVLSGITLGTVLPYLFNLSGVLIGDAGVNHYAEVHTTALNSYCHTVGMPIFIYVTLLWFPVIFNDNYNYKLYTDIQRLLYTTYITHYISIDYTIGAAVGVVYAVPLYYADHMIKNIFDLVQDTNDYKVQRSFNDTFNYIRVHVFVYGFSIAFAAMVFQEVFGHWLSGDPQSRLESVPNAILYAIYYSISHIF